MNNRPTDEQDAMHRDPYRHMPTPIPYRKGFSWAAFIFFSWVVLGSVAMMVTSHATPFEGRSNVFLFASVGMLLGVAGSVATLIYLGRFPREERPFGIGFAAASLPIGLILAWVGSAMVHTAAYVPSYMGRRHRKGKKLMAPETEPGSDWIQAAPTELGVPDEARGPLAAEWRDNGKKEHASVAAFAQLTLDLMAVGAPPDLVAAAQRDALDEVRHAASCFAIARDIDGRTESPSPFPDARARRYLFTASRQVALTQIAIDALADGVLNEGIASRLLAQLAKQCDLPAMAPILREMAADESRHAAHSWDIVAWCLASGGKTVEGALRGAIDGMPKKVCSALPAGARDGAWERWGVHGVAMEAEAFAKTRESARKKLRVMMEDHAARRLRRAISVSSEAAIASARSPGTSAPHASEV